MTCPYRCSHYLPPACPVLFLPIPSSSSSIPSSFSSISPSSLIPLSVTSLTFGKKITQKSFICRGFSHYYSYNRCQLYLPPRAIITSYMDIEQRCLPYSSPKSRSLRERVRKHSNDNLRTRKPCLGTVSPAISPRDMFWISMSKTF